MAKLGFNASNREVDSPFPVVLNEKHGVTLRCWWCCVCSGEVGCRLFFFCNTFQGSKCSAGLCPAPPVMTKKFEDDLPPSMLVVVHTVFGTRIKMSIARNDKSKTLRGKRYL